MSSLQPPAVTILVVEDDAIIAWDIAMQIRDLGFGVVGPAASGERAIALAESERPALALMDIHLRGGMDGITTAQVLRERFDLPSVFLSAFATQGGLDRASAARPAGFLSKPFTEGALRDALAAALATLPARS